MRNLKVYSYVVSFLGILTMVLSISSCESKNQDSQKPSVTDHLTDFPAFITPTEEYFDIRLNGIPSLASDSYQLRISGAIDHPATYTLEDLRNLDMVERTLTIECIDNRPNDHLLGTATWKGFRVYDLLKSLGIKAGASTVKYHCADGYFTYNTLEELENKEVLGALYMNGESIPASYGFPLRIIFPGYYGVRQPGWVLEMELMETGFEDYYSRWKTDSSMAVDSKIFFPVDNEKFTPGESIKIGGAAYGGRRISSVEITGDDGRTWTPASLIDSLDQDYVWIFWEVNYTPQSTGTITIHARATAQDGSVQPREDNDIFDGINSWPAVTISVEEGS